MVFRKDTKVDAFQRQISALRQQLGDSESTSPERAPAPDHGDFEPVSYPSAEGRRYDAFDAPPSDFAPVQPDVPTFPNPGLDAQTSVVAHDTVWKGDLQTNGTVHVHGRVEGSVSAKLDVFVADEAEVTASVLAENVSVAGLVRGTVRCHNRFEVLPQGRVAGDVFAPVLVVHEGALINGELKMTDLEQLAPAAPVPASLQRRAARSGS